CQMGRLRTLEPGMLSSVQDLGRPGWASLGVPVGGAADPLSLRLGNRLVGNAEGAAAIEMTLKGGRFRFDSAATIALAGAEARATLGALAAGGTPGAPWAATAIGPGQTLNVGFMDRGARAYLCIAGGGIRVPRVMGSTSTHLGGAGSGSTDDGGGFGGLEGRALRAGDIIE